MVVLREGHRYALESLEGGEPQTIQFIEKMPAASPELPMVTAYDGTTNEEVLKVLINRLEYLNGKMRDATNEIAIVELKSALYALELRTADRVRRGVEGTSTT